MAPSWRSHASPCPRCPRAVHGLRERRAPGARRGLPRSEGTLVFTRELVKEGKLGFWRWFWGDGVLGPTGGTIRSMWPGRGRPSAGGPRSRHRAQYTENRQLIGRSCAPPGADESRMPRFSKPDTRVHDALRRIGPLPVLGGTVSRIRRWRTTRTGRRATWCRDRVRRGLRREPPTLRQLGGQRAPDPRAHDPPGGHAARPPRARADRARGRDLPLPGALPRRRAPRRGQLHVHAVTVAAYSETAADLRGAHTDTAHLAGLLHDVGKLLMPAAFGVQPLEDIAAAGPSAPPAPSSSASYSASTTRRGRAAGGAERARRRRHPRDRLPPRRPDRARLPVARGRVRASRGRLAHLVAGDDPDRELLASRSSASTPAPSCWTRSPSSAGVAPYRCDGRSRRRRRPARGGRAHRRPDRPAQPPLLARHRPPRARRRRRGRAADLRRRRLQGRQRGPRPPRRRPRPDRGRARARPPRRRRPARRRRVRRLGPEGGDAGRRAADAIIETSRARCRSSSSRRPRSGSRSAHRDAPAAPRSWSSLEAADRDLSRAARARSTR